MILHAACDVYVRIVLPLGTWPFLLVEVARATTEDGRRLSAQRFWDACSHCLDPTFSRKLRALLRSPSQLLSGWWLEFLTGFFKELRVAVTVVERAHAKHRGLSHSYANGKRSVERLSYDSVLAALMADHVRRGGLDNSVPNAGSLALAGVRTARVVRKLGTGKRQGVGGSIVRTECNRKIREAKRQTGLKKLPLGQVRAIRAEVRRDVRCASSGRLAVLRHNFKAECAVRRARAAAQAEAERARLHAALAELPRTSFWASGSARWPIAPEVVEKFIASVHREGGGPIRAGRRAREELAKTLTIDAPAAPPRVSKIAWTCVHDHPGLCVRDDADVYHAVVRLVSALKQMFRYKAQSVVHGTCWLWQALGRTDGEERIVHEMVAMLGRMRLKPFLLVYAVASAEVQTDGSTHWTLTTRASGKPFFQPMTMYQIAKHMLRCGQPAGRADLSLVASVRTQQCAIRGVWRSLRKFAIDGALDPESPLQGSVEVWSSTPTARHRRKPKNSENDAIDAALAAMKTSRSRTLLMKRHCNHRTAGSGMRVGQHEGGGAEEVDAEDQGAHEADFQENSALPSDDSADSSEENDSAGSAGCSGGGGARAAEDDPRCVADELAARSVLANGPGQEIGGDSISKVVDKAVEALQLSLGSCASSSLEGAALADLLGASSGAASASSSSSVLPSSGAPSSAAGSAPADPLWIYDKDVVYLRNGRRQLGRVLPWGSAVTGLSMSVKCTHPGHGAKCTRSMSLLKYADVPDALGQWLVAGLSIENCEEHRKLPRPAPVGAVEGGEGAGRGRGRGRGRMHGRGEEPAPFSAAADGDGAGRGGGRGRVRGRGRAQGRGCAHGRGEKLAPSDAAADGDGGGASADA